MKFLGNLIWFLLGGAIVALLFFFLGFVCCVTIVLIPFGKQFFKLAGLIVAPFKKEVYSDYDTHPYLNIIWMILDPYVILTFLIGIILCVTVIGIPFGKQCLKVARLAAAPFGAIVEKL